MTNKTIFAVTFWMKFVDLSVYRISYEIEKLFKKHLKGAQILI